MEDNNSLFFLSIDPSSKQHLTEAAKWARFLAIVGFVCLGLLILSGLFASLMFSRFQDTSRFSSRAFGGGYMGAASAIMYIIMAVIYFFPLLYLLRFANAMRAALTADDQERLMLSFQNLKACFRYVGIITIITLAFIAISLIITITAAASFSS